MVLPVPKPGDACRPVRGAVRVDLKAGEVLRVVGSGVTIAPAVGPHDAGLPLTYDSGGALTPVLGRVAFRVYPARAHRPARVCGPRDAFR